MKEMAKSNGKIVTTVVENCYNCSGKICYIVTNFPLDLAISFILLYETTITEKMRSKIVE